MIDVPAFAAMLQPAEMPAQGRERDEEHVQVGLGLKVSRVCIRVHAVRLGEREPKGENGARGIMVEVRSVVRMELWTVEVARRRGHCAGKSCLGKLQKDDRFTTVCAQVSRALQRREGKDADSIVGGDDSMG